ncbi:diguanylate cyclase response regulator [Alteromonas mediterranea]|jgi:diguanylate cyclase (GGDEF)-like protein|uniref:diguanylate cyclase n=3 Tax=Alteromonas mediterranea TaxID=314275 RepID=A0AAC8XGM2_9ALTE|nr:MULTISPECIES: diguanylate cyclase [Alteromonas]AGP76601.1 response regulator/GGDEF domain-containing protein [Alteromonas mediterranea 615]AGP91952.1 response regulator/GGDEF domain-containing protein [Alteromonas mediterranea U8]MBR9895354.1 diguanylate cyclase [Gammaproteobacteria bacterium]MDY6883348.1 diguanylate cyclase [Pseudomonadota bacterium]AEA96345.1 diguanylate cyclase [Alteromonas mediterranea DE]|tara:strand:+ start:386 stop:1666 length:1281 start_codon:yes stop_codon:yes gene_type:complete
MQQHVLILENGEGNLELIAKLVRRAGLTPVGATSLTEGKARFSQKDAPETFLCAIVAYSLPDARKGEAIDFTVKSFIPTIATTESLDSAIRDKVLERDVVDYIPKENSQNYDYLNRLIGRLEKNKSTGVIVVSTNRVLRTKTVSLLQRHNFIAFECLTATDAMQCLSEHNNVRLVITDNTLPDMTGTHFVSSLRKAFSKEQLAIMGVAGGKGMLMSAHFIKSGANDFLRVPYCHEEFLCRVMQNVEYIESVEEIRRVANTDYLTGLPNRRHFFYMVTVQHQKLLENHALALIDLDFFKSINDTHGHDAGDIVLKAIAALIEFYFPDEIISRFGGEEFCIYMPSITLENACKRLEDFRKVVEAEVIQLPKTDIKVTCSIGVSGTHTQRVDKLLSLADKQLYAAKHDGRNQVKCEAPGASYQEQASLL